ncbi:SHOCT domain-containing protein, partial [Staphylococcus epidermidis]
FEPADNLAVRKLYTALADFLEKPTVEEEDLSYVKTGDLIMAYLKMRDDGLMTHEEFEEKKKRILGME